MWKAFLLYMVAALAFSVWSWNHQNVPQTVDWRLVTVGGFRPGATLRDVEARLGRPQENQSTSNYAHFSNGVAFATLSDGMELSAPTLEFRGEVLLRARGNDISSLVEDRKPVPPRPPTHTLADAERLLGAGRLDDRGYTCYEQPGSDRVLQIASDEANNIFSFSWRWKSPRPHQK